MAESSGNDDIKDLIGFLTNEKLMLRKMAAEAVAGLTGSPAGLAALRPYLDEAIPKLFRILSDEAAEVSGNAAGALVNLSGDPPGVAALLKAGVCNRVMTHVRELTCPHHDLLMMLLSNVTLDENGALQLVQHEHEELMGLNLAILLKLFVDSAGATSVDLYEHVASVLCNVTHVKTARQIVLQRGRGLLNALLPQLSSTSETRRRGTAAAFKNCCMTAEEDATIDVIVDDKDLLKGFLQHISGGSLSNKDDQVRENLAEAMLALAGTRKGREVLVEIKAHEALRDGYAAEENQAVCSAMERAMDALLRSGVVRDEIQKHGEGAMIMGD